ncbi:MAG: hypothetical protein LPK09_08660 [Hymenobacteraceae bacterium]|nr:hypothetical protein [Hymenobacteraceae bacterium]
MKDSTHHIGIGKANITHIAKNKCYELAYDESKNRIYYSILGFWKSTENIPDFLNDWNKTLAAVSPGFTLLIDMRTMITHPQQLNSLHEESQRKVKAMGVSKVANVMPTDKIANLQVAAISSRTDLPIRNFETTMEAEHWLDQVDL